MNLLPILGGGGNHKVVFSLLSTIRYSSPELCHPWRLYDAQNANIERGELSHRGPYSGFITSVKYHQGEPLGQRTPTGRSLRPCCVPIYYEI